MVFLVCLNGIFGEECKFICGYCYGNIVCDYVNGSCVNGCVLGWIGVICNESECFIELFVIENFNNVYFFCFLILVKVKIEIYVFG